MGDREARLARALATHRRNIGVRQADLAEQLHISCDALRRWERGIVQPGPDKVRVWAAALGLHLAVAYQLTPVRPVRPVSRETDISR